MTAAAGSLEACRGASGLAVGGFVPFSAADFPGALAAVVFCQGCPWRCRYCHNPHLQPSRAARPLAWPELCATLERRRGLLDAVVFSGGEPTAQPGLAQAVKRVRELGFRAGLHTAGIYPRRLAALLPDLDWVGLDVKTLPARYAALTGVSRGARAVDESLRLLAESGIAFEVRTTVHPELLAASELLALAERLAARGVRRYAVQQFRSRGCADAALRRSPGGALPGALCETLRAMFQSFELRAA